MIVYMIYGGLSVAWIFVGNWNQAFWMLGMGILYSLTIGKE